jgi:cation diffusion facilitator family transporter
MPEPQADPNLTQIRTTAFHALVAGAVITLLKFSIFWATNSVAVLSDALESIINVAAAAMLMYSIWLSNRPADHDHPYGHGKIEFLAVGLEGWLILLSGLLIAVEAIRRLLVGQAPRNLEWGIWLLAGVGVLSAILAAYVYTRGRKFNNATLIADGKHLLTDVASTFGVLLGLILVHWSGKYWVDALVAMLMASLILFVSWRLLWQSIRGLMDQSDPQDDARIREILDDEQARGAIRGYHKVRHRHNGSFHWVDMHLQVEGHLSVAEGHALASRIEHRIEQTLGQANATAHLEPAEIPS